MGGTFSTTPNNPCQRAFAEHKGEPLSVRVGLNAGEPIEEDGDLFGVTVILASRIAAKADGGEILVADTVRGLCSGKGFLFADRGEFVAKGFKEPVRVSEVSWRTDAQPAHAATNDLVYGLSELIQEGNAILERFGRPEYSASQRAPGLRETSKWNARVLAVFVDRPHLIAEFVNDGDIFDESSDVWKQQLKVRLNKLGEFVRRG
jgi:hypothetical protein